MLSPDFLEHRQMLAEPVDKIASTPDRRSYRAPAREQWTVQSFSCSGYGDFLADLLRGYRCEEENFLTDMY